MGDKTQRLLRNKRSVNKDIDPLTGSKEREVKSQGEEVLVLPESRVRDLTMEGIEALKEFGRVMADNVNRQMEEQREYYKEREEKNLRR